MKSEKNDYHIKNVYIEEIKNIKQKNDNNFELTMNVNNKDYLYNDLELSKSSISFRFGIIGFYTLNKIAGDSKIDRNNSFVLCNVNNRNSANQTISRRSM